MALVLRTPCTQQVAQDIPGVIPPVFDPNQNGGSESFSSTTSITRPNDTTPYNASDVVGGLFTFSNVGIAGSPVVILGSRFEIRSAALPSGMSNFLIHLYSSAPPSAFVDNTPFNIPSSDWPFYLGLIDLGTPVDFGDILYVENNTPNKVVDLVTADLFGYLVTVGSYTPAAQTVHRVTFSTVRV